mgnify:FL=1
MLDAIAASYMLATMLYAVVDEKRSRAHKDAIGATCGCCNAPVVAKCGAIVAWHWAHKSRVDCDRWSEGESEWHLSWKRLVHPDLTEVVIGPHRADIRATTGTVVELQHSYLPAAEIAERESFYGDMVWVFDATAAAERMSVRAPEVDNAPFFLRWKHPSTMILQVQRPLYLDVGDGWLFALTDKDRMLGHFLSRGRLLSGLGLVPPSDAPSEHELAFMYRWAHADSASRYPMVLAINRLNALLGRGPYALSDSISSASNGSPSRGFSPKVLSASMHRAREGRQAWATYRAQQETARAERERIEQERLEQERAERERIEQKRTEQERTKKEQIAEQERFARLYLNCALGLHPLDMAEIRVRYDALGRAVCVHVCTHCGYAEGGGRPVARKRLAGVVLYEVDEDRAAEYLRDVRPLRWEWSVDGAELLEWTRLVLEAAISNTLQRNPAVAESRRDSLDELIQADADTNQKSQISA